MTDAITNVTGAYFSNEAKPQKSGNGAIRFPGECIPQSMEDMLKTLADMGFTDRELNRSIINEKGGSLSDDVIDAIMQRGSGK